MSKLTVKLTRPQIDALLNAATSMLAGQEGEGDFLCKADVLDRAADALAAAASVKRRPTTVCTGLAKAASHNKIYQIKDNLPRASQ